MRAGVPASERAAVVRAGVPTVPVARQIHGSGKSVVTRHQASRSSITLGEVIYNVRSALDFLVYSIARANNDGVELDGTQFPLEDHAGAYWTRWTGKNAKGKPINAKAHWLKNIPKAVAVDLEHYQPYACSWTKLIRDVSNRDKHRHLSTLTVTLGFRPTARPVRPIDPVDEKQAFVFPSGIVEIGIYLPDGGQDVLDAAHLIQREARALIRSYARIFKLPPPGLIENEFPTQAPSGA